MSTTPRYFHFNTIHEGAQRSFRILGDNARDAVQTLREGLYDGETIVGWDS